MELAGSCHCGVIHFTVQSHTPYPYMRCFCSICRKTAGGGGYAINIMGVAETLTVSGEDQISTYHARLFDRHDPQHVETSLGVRHFCRQCGSALWVWDPRWPELVHPFASAIDTPLPRPPEYWNIFLADKPDWVVVPRGPDDHDVMDYPTESIEAWHRRLGLWQP